MMLTNADCTVYEKDTFIRHAVPDIYWNVSRGQTVNKNGIQVSDSITVYIYDTDYVPKAGDMIVKGLVDFEFDASSQSYVRESMAQFRQLFPEFAYIKAVNDCRYGGLPHIEVIAR